MLVLGSILAPSMLHTAFPAFPVVVPPSESRRMISTWHSHNCVFRQLLLTFLNSDVICDESQERWGHFGLLVASIWSVDAKLWTLSRNFPTFTPATSFPFPIDPVKVFCPVRVKNNSGHGPQLFFFLPSLIHYLRTHLPSFLLGEGEVSNRRYIIWTLIYGKGMPL